MLGLIPIGGPCTIADSLGIPGGVEACETLSRRVAQKVDLGSANGHLFISEVRIAGANVTAETDGSFRMTVLAPEAEILVSNMRNREMAEGLAPERAGDPMDGLLDLLVINRAPASGLMGRFRQEVDVTVIPTHKVLLTAPEAFAVLCDGREFSTDNLAVEIVPDRLKIITGRERVFANEDEG